MALGSAALGVAAGALESALAYASLHSATPNSSGSNETTAARVAVSWDVAGGVLSASGLEFEGVASNGDVVAVGFWSAAEGGTFYGSLALTGDSAANAAGEYTVESVEITVSAS